MRNGKDPDPELWVWLTDWDPGGPKTWFRKSWKSVSEIREPSADQSAITPAGEKENPPKTRNPN